MFWMSCVSFWAVLRCMVFNSWHFRTLCLFHLHRPRLWGWKRHSVLKHRLLNTIHQRTIQKITHNMFLSPPQIILGRWTPEQISAQYWWQFPCTSQESNFFTSVTLQQTSLPLQALLSKTWAKLSVSLPQFAQQFEILVFEFCIPKITQK
jgi:hypothetical protein